MKKINVRKKKWSQRLGMRHNKKILMKMIHPYKLKENKVNFKQTSKLANT